jgi:hypothetical protein
MTNIPDGATHVVVDIYHLKGAQKKSNERYPYRKKSGSSWLAWCGFEWVPVVNADPSKYQALKHAWNGEGLPPVGTVCEYFFLQTPTLGNEIGTIICRDRVWVKAEVLFHHFDGGRVYAVINAPGYGYRGCSDTTGEMFRPIRTPEQIAAEERRSAIDALAEELGGHWSEEAKAPHRDIAAYLHDIGYRKQTEK